MGNLKRFGVSMEEGLLNKFDQLIEEKGYENRSEAVRDLVRNTIVQESTEKDEEFIAGSILIFYNHRQQDLMQELTKIQHNLHHEILATTHFHLDADNCLEIIVVKGAAQKIRAISNQLISIKGVNYGKFTAAPLNSFEEK
ncbi:nickel-responsive transcriptional regulator NikR [Bacillus sp. FJAT-44742]|uniref:nickel-responsive transcriptional regulator NikR n=1 Tax=Bacillus sp. FJAT-44742 TaxID=2014005 RepID=UPI000C23DABB|nr:nickel-responsive transcriptional regulator NikR [Bacillus sp. FJAT-44742]